MLGQQLNLSYKLGHLYHESLEKQAADSKISFQNFSTPGWTSMVRTEMSKQTKPQQLKTHNILEKLNKLQHINLSQSQFSKVRLPEQESQNILVFNKHVRTEEDNGKQNNVKSNQLIKLNNSRMVNSQNEKTRKSTLKQWETGESRVQNEANKKTNEPKIKARFNRITVHQHLYLDGKKQQTKKAMQRILEHQYQRKHVTTFRPAINPKSQQLAQIRFSRLTQQLSLQQQLIEEINKIQKKTTNHKTQQVDKVYLNINYLFYFLTEGQEVLDRVNLTNSIKNLPLMCIKVLQKIIQKVYQGSTYSWLEFLGAINDKKIVKNKQGLTNVFAKWKSRTQQQCSPAKKYHQASTRN